MNKIQEIKKLVIEKRERDRLKEENEKKELENRKTEWRRVQDKCKIILNELPEEYEFKVYVKSFGFIYVTKGRISGYDIDNEKKEFDKHYGEYMPLAGYGTHPKEQEAYESLVNDFDSVLDQIMEQLKK